MKRKEFSRSEESGPNMNPAFKRLLESDVGIIASHVYGYESLKTIFSPDPLTQEVTQKSILQNSNVWMHRMLQGIEPPLGAVVEDNRPGRLGLPQVRFDSTAQVGTLVMSADRLHAQAHSNFSSVRANVCFYSGKWQYELQLESKGVMQLGWSMADGEFSAETGVGDSVYSFGFDGNRVRKWNLVTMPYGEAWQIGDIIGCTIDLDVGSIHFYRNGKNLGEAFSSIPLGPGCAYYPAISLAFEEKIQANFGSMPFKYPVETFLPAQQPPSGAILRVNQLLHWLYRASSVPRTKVPQKDSPKRKQSWDAASLMFCELLVGQLAPLLNQLYVVDACLVPFLHDITSVTQDKKSLPSTRSLDRLNFFCDSLRLFLEPDDFKELISAIIMCLIQKFNQTSSSLDYIKQKNSLAIFSDICQNNSLRISLLKQLGFVKTRIPQFMDVKPIDVVALKQSVPEAWWSQDAPNRNLSLKLYEARKQMYFGNCQTIKQRTRELEVLQENVLMLFLNNSDNTATEGSSRKYFLHLFRTFLKDNHISGLNNQNMDQIPLPIALSYFHRLVNVVRVLWTKECPQVPAHVPTERFYNGSVDYFSIDRLGGVLSHLIHTFRAPLVDALGEDHRVLTEPQPQPSMTPSVQVQVRGIDTNTGVVSTLTRWINLGGALQGMGQVSGQGAGPGVAPGHVSNVVSLTELLDGIIMLYSLTAHKQLHKISTLRDDMDKYVAALNEARSRLNLAKKTCPQAVDEIEFSIQTFEHKIEEQSRVTMAWVRGVVYTPEKRADLVWLLEAVLNTLEIASQQGDLFSFVPDFYVDSLVEICTALRSYFSPTLPLEELEGYKRLLVRVAEWLVQHFADPRVVHLSSRDTMIEALAAFITKRPTMNCLESISVKSQEKFVGLLLKPYDNRPWGQSNWILMRMWQGCGFAYRYQRSPHLSRKLGPRTPSSESGLLIHQAFEPCPSPQYQQVIAQLLYQDQEMAAEFLNSVLKQLNWSFSEFISMIQEIQNLSKRPERVIIDARQLKICATCFDFVLSLLRVLEMICTVCLPIFTDDTREGTENLLERLCQLLSQILLRVTSPTGCFAHVISLEVPDLDSIDQFPVLSAVVGVLIALLAKDIAGNESSKMSTAAKGLLSEPAFQIDSLRYVLGEAKAKNENQENFSLKNYPEAVSESELATVSRLVSCLSRYQAHMSAARDVDDEELCPICCAMPLAVTFMPCHHRSCKSCITHHLMDCKECFFCKTAINTVVSMDGKCLFDAATSAHKVANLNPSPPI